MNLDAYSIAQLQMCQTFLVQAGASGLDLAAIQVLLAGRLANYHHPVAPETGMCPSCGRGQLIPVANGDGLHIIGCRSCRYSELLGDHHG